MAEKKHKKRVSFTVLGRPVKKKGRNTYRSGAYVNAEEVGAFEDLVRDMASNAIERKDEWQPPYFGHAWLAMEIKVWYKGKIFADIDNIPQCICDAPQSRTVSGIDFPGVLYYNDNQIDILTVTRIRESGEDSISVLVYEL